MQGKASVGEHEPQSKVSGFWVLGHLPALSTRDLNSSNWPSCRCVASYKKKKDWFTFGEYIVGHFQVKIAFP
jgi:hypothetical protein